MICKVTYDGTHYVASAPGFNAYEGSRRRKEKTAPQQAFTALWRDARPKMNARERKEHIIGVLGDTFGATCDWVRFYKDEEAREDKNFFARKKRMEQKTFLNQWNYFCTFTYDGEKNTPETFEKRLRASLSHLCSRRGWRYIMVREFSPEKERMHFHGLFFVPEGEMVGTIREERSFSTRHHRMQTAHINSFFEERFGRNDFQKVNLDKKDTASVVAYLLKYLRKSGDRVIYSRHVPAEIVADIKYEHCVCRYFDWVDRFVLFDDWQHRNTPEPHILEGDAVDEWLICFEGKDENIDDKIRNYRNANIHLFGIERIGSPTVDPKAWRMYA